MERELGLGRCEAAVAARLRAWRDGSLGRRLWEKDPTLWAGASPDCISTRMGWLDLPWKSQAHAAAWNALARAVAGEGTADVVLLGMGGSSLAPEVFATTFGAAHGYPRLAVLDSTHPGAVLAVDAALALERSLFIVSSKSGTTIETRSLFSHFFERIKQKTADPGRHFVGITDQGTQLDDVARREGFRATINPPSDVGGRFSALSGFGLVPAAMAGADIGGLLEAAREAAVSCGSDVPEDMNPGLALGAALGEAALAGRDKLTFFSAPSLAGLPAWIEQLVAESAGKNGKGIVPIVGEPRLEPDMYGDDRVFVYVALKDDACPDCESLLDALESRGHPVVRIVLNDRSDLGAEMFIWEIATAAACAVLGVNPFDQPDVEVSKRLAIEAMAKADTAVPVLDTAAIDAADPSAVRSGVSDLLAKARKPSRSDGVRSGSYVSIQAYLQPRTATTERLQALRLGLAKRTGLPTTLGYGPRFLHSTGQLHKGGPDEGVFIQIADRPAADVPASPGTQAFGDLIRAQGLGDIAALRQRGRPAMRIEIAGDADAGLAEIVALIGTQEAG